jgi:hypothetical protein
LDLRTEPSEPGSNLDFVSIQAVGVWLVGVGAAILAAVGLLAVGPPRLNMMATASGDTRLDRLRHAISGAGLLAGAAGSVLLAVSSVPTVQVAGSTVAGIAAVIYLLLAWRVHALWTARLGDAEQTLLINQDSDRAQWQLDCAHLCSRWRWSLAHPLTDIDATSWPEEEMGRKLGPAPAGPPQSDDPDLDAKMRQVNLNVAMLRANSTPGWISDIAAVTRHRGWTVLHAAKTVTFYTPDRATSVSCTLADPGSLVSGLRREELLRSLRQMGLPTHRAKRGQSLPGIDSAELINALAASNAEEQATLIQ